MGAPAASNVELKVSMTGLDPSRKVPVDRIWGWIHGQLPGRRYMKLLTRLALKQAEYEQIISMSRPFGTLHKMRRNLAPCARSSIATANALL
jgi:hypothetical protein